MTKGELVRELQYQHDQILELLGREPYDTQDSYRLSVSEGQKDAFAYALKLAKQLQDKER